MLLPGFGDYGLTIPQFSLTTIILPESDPNYKRLRELHTVMLQKRVAEQKWKFAYHKLKVVLLI